MSRRFDELREQLRLAGPVVLVNLALMGMGLVDTHVLGHVSTEAYAAVGLGLTWFWSLMVLGLGIIMSLDAVVSQAHGAGDDLGVSRALQRGVLLAVLLGLALAPLTLVAAPLFTALGQPEALIAPAASYVHVLSFAFVPALLFAVFRQTLQAMHRVRELVLVALLANALNYVLNWALYEGWWGLPALGLEGIAWATVFCDVAMVGGLLITARRMLRPRLWPLASRVLHLRPLLRMLNLGLPIGVQLVLESSAFHAVTFLIGYHMGAVELGGHRTALTLASTSFMVPLGLSTAVAVRVGHCVGRGDVPAARSAAKVGLVLGASFMALCGLTFALFPRELSRLLTNQEDVLVQAVVLMPFAAAFQLFDGVQVVASGVLRGLGDTRWPMLINFFGYWAIAIPLGAAWVAWWGGGADSLWIALGVALALVGAGMLLRGRRRLAGPLRRLEIDRAG